MINGLNNGLNRVGTGENKIVIPLDEFAIELQFTVVREKLPLYFFKNKTDRLGYRLHNFYVNYNSQEYGISRVKYYESHSAKYNI